jgi:UrcA family protein
MFGYRIHTLAVSLSAALVLSVVPLAGSAAQTRSLSVHSTDLDLTSEAGRAELQHRIDRAVDRVCGPLVGVPLDQVHASADCSRTARAAAMNRYAAVIKEAEQRKLAAR